MKTYNRVIKSEDVAYRPRQGAETPGSGETPRGKAGQTASDLPGLKAALAREVQSARQQAHAEGLAEGIEKGKALHRQELRQPIESLTALLAEVAKIRQTILERDEQQILDLALAVAEKVIHLEVTTNREVIRGVLKEAIRHIADRDGLKIRIHPQDFSHMMEIKSDFLQTLDGIKNLVFEQDESIARGGALIETLYGEVDARLDQQYQEVKGFLQASRGPGSAAR
jgi:flagellar assembly protein FliH